MWEGLGGAVIEAMAMGVPVISFDIPAVVEALGGTGIVVPVGDTRRLGDAIDLALSSPERRAELGQMTKARFDANYTIESTCAAMKHMYVEVASEGRESYRDPFRKLRRR